MSYDLSFVNGTNVTNMFQATIKVNEASNYLFGTLLMIAIFVGVYFAFKKEETIREWVISGFVSSIIGMLLILMNLVTWQILIGIIFIFFITFLLNFFM